MRRVSFIFCIILLTACSVEDNIITSVEENKPTNEISSSIELKEFMNNIRWEVGMVSMHRPYDHIFHFESTKYKLWYNHTTSLENIHVTLVPNELHANRWVTLNSSDSEKLVSLLRNIYHIEFN